MTTHKVFKLCICIILSFLLSCSQSKETLETPSITVNIHDNKGEWDMTNILDSVCQIIPLETRPECLLSSIGKIEMKDRKLFILDQAGREILIFDESGKYLSKICALGRGPGEYQRITDMTLLDNTILVVDNISRRQIEYSFSGEYLKETRIFDKLWCMNIFTLSNTVYYINDWSDSSVGKFRLYTMDQSGEVKKHLPFDTAPTALGISGPVYGKTEESVSIIYSGCDDIFRVDKQGNVGIAYRILFENPKAEYNKDHVEDVYKDNQKDRIIGVSAIQESNQYLFLNINTTGDQTCNVLFDKNSQNTIIYNYGISTYFKHAAINGNQIIDEKIINHMEANVFHLIYSNLDLPNNQFGTRIKEILSSTTPDNNPILFIYNIKAQDSKEGKL